MYRESESQSFWCSSSVRGNIAYDQPGGPMHGATKLGLPRLLWFGGSDLPIMPVPGESALGHRPVTRGECVVKAWPPPRVRRTGRIRVIRLAG